MVFNVATNFSEDFLDEVSKFKEVKILFGKLKKDFIGGGCESSLLGDISREYLTDYIKRAAAKGIQFNYVINSPTINNEELTYDGRKQLNELLEFLSDLELESVTVANPYMVMYIKENFKKLRIKASANFVIDSVAKARYLKNLGIDILVLDPLLVNRDFKTLKAIRKEIGSEIELLVNNNCLLNCPFLFYHQNYLGAHSRMGDADSMVDVSYMNCSLLRLSDPIYYIKSDWIRPEDMDDYLDIGYERFKITDRCAPNDVLLRRVKAYAEKKYDGNLLDLIQHYYYRDNTLQDDYLENVYIDNRQLDGFIRHFKEMKCDGRNCVEGCNYCRDYAKKAVRINTDFSKNQAMKKSESLKTVLLA